jgi:hypothetical protein
MLLLHSTAFFLKMRFKVKEENKNNIKWISNNVKWKQDEPFSFIKGEKVWVLSNFGGKASRFLQTLLNIDNFTRLFYVFVFPFTSIDEIQSKIMYRGEMGRECGRCVGVWKFSNISDNSSYIDPSPLEWEKKHLYSSSPPQKINTIFTGMIWRLKQKPIFWTYLLMKKKSWSN